MTDLASWLAEAYAPAYKTACLILRNKADAEEAVQDAFLRAWKFRDAIGSGDKVKPWLYRVVVNSCMTKLRQEIPHRDRRIGDGNLADVPDADAAADPGERAERSELAKAMVDALDGLPSQLRIPVVLRYYAQLSEREIAVAIRKRPGTVKSRLHEARRRLAEVPGLQALASQWGGTESMAGTGSCTAQEAGR